MLTCVSSKHLLNLLTVGLDFNLCCMSHGLLVLNIMLAGIYNVPLLISDF